VAGFVALLDACVMVPIALTDTLLRLAEAELYRPAWSQKILDEARAAILEIHPDEDPGRVDARLRSMNEAFEGACVQNWQPLVEGLTLPDDNDRHVLAAAIRGNAGAIITDNVRDFPSHELDKYGLHAVTPDEFLLDQLDLAPATVLNAVRQQAADTRRPRLTVDDVLDSLSRSSARTFAEDARKLLPHENKSSS
jgi:predicted nucleic acid-binding protein